ncbi:RNA polymerase sigma-70 factor [Chitinophaga sancti]|uniref:RNA polymerase sigma-70 factor n=1 Tax=Chitinophaga sancti TaxID=1004 RepID=A0A1K1PGP5_9BACT|nr:RNA polymerase sigma-70 factor [Chitinophaga sancti]WQD65897.1 RNA polymerase sigma-70 factor [Chitinophaga sancti]WQG88481.1 RNA polymerase sigma-70 factor [Chitinophaga sancti]SFW46764.1 RNA polymerase sigma-70 factor, ECF subfamily [Chitinophaga sancti]
MQKEVNINDLWERFTKGSDARSFEVLFHELNPRLIKFCTLYVHYQQVAEEIVSDVFVKCWMDRVQMQVVEKPETYLFIAVKNQALNYNKRFSSIQVVNIEDHDGGGILINEASPEMELEKKELIFKMDQAIGTLPRQCGIIFRLIKENGMKYKEVAEILNISHRTVHTQMLRAMKKMSKAMDPYLKKTNRQATDNLISTILVLFIFMGN